MTKYKQPLKETIKEIQTLFRHSLDIRLLPIHRKSNHKTCTQICHKIIQLDKTTLSAQQKMKPSHTRIETREYSQSNSGN